MRRLLAVAAGPACLLLAILPFQPVWLIVSTAHRVLAAVAVGVVLLVVFVVNVHSVRTLAISPTGLRVVERPTLSLETVELHLIEPGLGGRSCLLRLVSLRESTEPMILWDDHWFHLVDWNGLRTKLPTC